MKKLFLLSIAMLSLASCSTMRQSATTGQITSPIVSAAVADLQVSSQKVTYTYKPTASVRRGGVQNCVNAAIKELLERNGNADVLVEAQEATVERKGLFGNKITSVTVSGFPAKFNGIQSVDKSTLKKSLENGFLPADKKTLSTVRGGLFK